MKIKGNTVTEIYQSRFSNLRYMPSFAVLFIWGYLLVAYPEASAEGVSNGIRLCIESIVPSLFPFLLFSSVLSGTGVLNSLIKATDKLTRLIFALPGDSLPIIAMSLIGGFPVGAFLIKKAVEKGALTQSQGKRMLLFCVNAGPAFTISTVGSMLLSSKKAGIIIYCSTAFSSLLLGIISRFTSLNDDAYATERSDDISQKTGFYTVITESVNSSSQAILNTCIWIVVFSCLYSLIELLPLNDSFVLFFKCFSEVTNGVITVLEQYPLPLVSGIISFGGFCVHLQLMPCLSALKMKYKHFITARIVSASFSIAVAYVLFGLFPVSISTVSLGDKPHAVSLGGSIPVCACLLILSGLFIIGDNYIFIRKTRKQTHN